MDTTLSKSELLAIASKMRATANEAYRLLMHCNVHAFIEFNGLMQKYVDLCHREAARGTDFTLSNTHTGVALKMEDHDVEYLAEKFACIFGPSFRKQPGMWALFKKRVEEG